MESINITKIKKIIAKQLKLLRKKRGETQEDVVKDVGELYLSLRSYKSYENKNNDHVPTIDRLLLLAKHFDVPVDTILTAKTYTDDESYTWKSSMKRLNRLIFSMVLSVGKIDESEIKKNPMQPKYYFASSDKEIEIYMDDICSFCKKKNYNFYRNSEKVLFSPKDLDNLIGQFAKDKTQLIPGPRRFEKTINKTGSTMEEWLKYRNNEAKTY